MPRSLTAEEVSALQEAQLVSPSPITGKLKVSSSIITPPPSDGQRSTSSSTGSSVVSIRYHSQSSSMRPTFDFPASTVSVEALEYVGFTSTTAQTIFRRFQNAEQVKDTDPDYHDLLLLTFVTSHINRVRFLDQSDPQAALREVGINEKTISAILAPAYTDIFQTETLHHWVEDTIEINFNSMRAKEQKLKIAAQHYLEQGRGKGTGKGKGKAAKRPKIED